MNEDILIAVYAILQASLRKADLLGEYAQPLYSRNIDEEDRTTIELYKWLSEDLKSITEKELNERRGLFNSIAGKLENEYFLNKFMFAIFMFENELGENGTVPQKIVLLPKINRLLKIMNKGVIDTAEENGDNGVEIIKDSKIAASNVVRMFRGLPELTKAMRAYRIDQWRKASRSANEKIDN